MYAKWCRSGDGGRCTSVGTIERSGELAGVSNSSKL